ncbi:MAG TPA: MoaD/ThiS family protein [Vicinamibacterales bacterium]|jgi:molybdopterin converting factor small subunit|nr:MoaD/ThiS family protein [Vicinamibacterales bacterium]
MATVHLPSGLARHTGGVDTVEIDAARVPDLFAALRDRFPLIADQLNDLAVAIDGEIYADPGYQSLRADSEVDLLPRIAGG